MCSYFIFLTFERYLKQNATDLLFVCRLVLSCRYTGSLTQAIFCALQAGFSGLSILYRYRSLSLLLIASSILVSKTMDRFSQEDSPLLGQCYKNPMYFVQLCNVAMVFIQPFQCPHFPCSYNVTQNTCNMCNVALLFVFIATLLEIH